MMGQLIEAAVFFLLGSNQRNSQSVLHRSSPECMTFHSPFAVFTTRTVWYVAKNSVTCFQSLMVSLLPYLTLLIALDDFLGFDQTAEDLFENLCQILSIFLQPGLESPPRKNKLLKEAQSFVDALVIQKELDSAYVALRHSPRYLF